MMKVALLVWIMLGTTLAGAAVLAVLCVPSLAPLAMKYIPMAGIGGYVVALPLSFVVAKQIMAKLNS